MNKLALLVLVSSVWSLNAEERPYYQESEQPEERALKPAPRIVGGEPAGQVVPYLVSLYKRDDPIGFLPVCGGTLITPSVVLTAAHCILDIQSAEIGRYNYEEDEPDVEKYLDIERRFHPLYDDSTFDYDFALIKLDRPHPDPVLVQLVRTSELPGDEMRIMGWGLIEADGDQSSILLDGTVTRFETRECQENYDPETVTENMFCANDDGPTDTCQGDSGGPILLPNSNRQIGITSWGSGCGNVTLPGVYARISSGHDWIEETVCTDISPDDCTDENKLPLVNEAGSIVPQSCDDYPSDFLGLGKKLKMRNCEWVGERRGLRCPWYHEYCPDTCQVNRCRS